MNTNEITVVDPELVTIRAKATDDPNNYVELDELDNGNLEIRLTNGEEFLDLYGKPYTDERTYLYDMLEDTRLLGNNWFAPTNLGLTEVPAIGYGAIYPNDEAYEPSDYDKLWIFPDYMIRSYMEELLRTGTVTFNLQR